MWWGLPMMSGVVGDGFTGRQLLKGCGKQLRESRELVLESKEVRDFPHVWHHSAGCKRGRYKGMLSSEMRKETLAARLVKEVKFRVAGVGKNLGTENLGEDRFKDLAKEVFKRNSAEIPFVQFDFKLDLASERSSKLLVGVRPDYERSSMTSTCERSSKWLDQAFGLKFSVERSAFERVTNDRYGSGGDDCDNRRDKGGTQKFNESQRIGGDEGDTHKMKESRWDSGDGGGGNTWGEQRCISSRNKWMHNVGTLQKKFRSRR
ncbi:hypothetical protein LR48_Vigan09g201500 [Vigna angularis]|uniref:Uncharacterized protein n=1 Tax=Phaseolus angularis TaxID=3914 RepID=A0A0L9VE66_PHAAN|nr:hypothetical protein LR48_Vigan09g201500 [Vigna angularis]